MKILVQVTQEDIDKGAAMSCMHCPIARALRRATNSKNVLVRSWACAWDEADFAQLPEAARRFITDFDTGKDVKPFEFELIAMV